MRKYEFKNATVYITKPTEAQKENIRKATERFVHRLAREGLIGNDKRRNNNGTRRAGSNARKRTRKTTNES